MRSGDQSLRCSINTSGPRKVLAGQFSFPYSLEQKTSINGHTCGSSLKVRSESRAGGHRANRRREVEGLGESMIQFHNVFKFYRTEGVTKIVLNHVSMTFDSTRSYGLLGVNGAGKSTTLRLISGTELPNSGKVRRTVRVSWPLGFSGGFHPLMTARENTVFAARAYGADLRKVIDFVEEFAEIGEYFDIPVKTYSSGMIARVAFGLSMAI